MAQKIKIKNGVKENWVETDNPMEWKSEAEKLLRKTKMQEIGKKHIRVPHPTLKNTFILKEKK